MPGPPRLRKSSKISIHPASNSSECPPGVSQSTRRRSRQTISQPPSRPLTPERKLSMKDNWKTVAREAFSVIDVNDDGFLQEEEVISAIKMMQEQGAMEFNDELDPVETAKKMMAEVDTDGDGQIDIDEFITMMRKSMPDHGIGGIPHSYNNRMSQLARNVLLAHQKKLENSVVGSDLWMIHPLSNFHAVWDVIVSLLILLTVLTMPLSIGWETFNDDFFAMGLTVDFIFLLDVCKNFCTGFIDENDAIIMDAKTVRENYLTGFFITDLCSSIPLDLILKSVSTWQMSHAYHTMRPELQLLTCLLCFHMSNQQRLAQ